MPKRMLLNSDGADCDLSDPGGEFTLQSFCTARRVPYVDRNAAVSLETFVAYGEAFQRRFAPQADTRNVSRIACVGEDFELTLDDGTRIEATKVVVATGVGDYPNFPAPFAKVSHGRVSHSSTLHEVSAFAGKRVMVIGAGASATDCAIALVDAGADVTVICREPRLPWAIPKEGRNARSFPLPHPLLFRRLPEWARVALVERTRLPAPSHYAREALEGRVRVMAAREVLDARDRFDGIKLELGRIGSQIEYLQADHILLGTGYRIDLNRLTLLAPELKARISRLNGAPRLDGRFESSMPGLYFAGALAAYSFGPSMGSIKGADFSARRIAAAIDDSFGARFPMRRPAVDDRKREAAPAQATAASRRFR